MSDRPHDEVSEYERQYEDGSDPRVLDLIDVPPLEPRPRGYQQENWLLDPKRYWVRVGQVRYVDLESLTDADGPLWINGHSTYNGLNDHIPLTEAAKVNTSLKLIQVEGICLKVFAPGEAFGNNKRRVQACFRFAGIDYALWATDPIIERDYLGKRDGDYRLGERFLTISLGEAFKDCCYKLVATVIEGA